VGDAEGLMTALGLLAIDRHLDGRRGHAFWLIVVAGLIRVEAWPFAAAYGAWLFATRQARWRVPAGGLLIAVLWFGGDWAGSGSLTTAAGRARHPIVGSPGASAHPALGVLHEAVQMLPPAAWAGVVVVLIAGLVSRRARPIRAGLALGGCAAVWTAIVALMAQRGYPGLPRFLFMASALEAVVAGIGAALVVERLTAPARPRARRRALVAAAVAVCTAFAFGALPNARLLPGDAAAVDQVADMDDGLAKAVTQAGGETALARCGQPVTPWYAVKALEWDLSAAATSVQARDAAPRRLVFMPDHDGSWDIHARDCPKLA